MSSIPGPNSTRYFRPTEVLTTLVLLSRLESWLAHYDPFLNMKTRCAEADCPDCANGFRAKRWYVFLAEVRGGERMWFELPERFYSQLVAIEAEHDSFVGLKVLCYKKGAASNSPIVLEVRGKSEVHEVAIEQAVLSFGTQTILRKSDLSEKRVS